MDSGEQSEISQPATESDAKDEEEAANPETSARTRNHSGSQDSLLVYIPNIKEELELDEERRPAAGVQGAAPRPGGEEPLNLVVRGCPAGQESPAPEDEAGDADYCSPLAVCSVELTEEEVANNINLNELFKPEQRQSKSPSAAPCKCRGARGARGKRRACCPRGPKATGGPAGKQFGCPACPAQFTQKCHVKRHMLTHTGERPFLCPVCGAKFALNCNFKSHLLVHSGEKPATCAVCGARFVRAGGLKEHMRFHSGARPFRCGACEARFTLRSHLRRHASTHTGEKPFACAVCGARFSRRGNVKDHMRTHTGEKPFGCAVCGAKFARRSHVKEHMLTHRGKALAGR
ncbi:zinc finger protein 771-like [Bacillus rossius redtenbacheri]|uniref:zinc finger protein 771-like n=1 Tax=Bacillus rossius redtenbacheri TaxID=93214 RepID=UPI002FDF0018